MSEKKNIHLDDDEKQIFALIAKNDTDGFKLLIRQLQGTVNFVDENGMTPLQHACCKGNKEVVQILLDMGANPSFHQHGADYTPLHFAALSGNVEVCRLLLDAGSNPHSINSVSRTASQMAAFVGNHACVETINNYVPREQLEYYTQVQGLQTEPFIPPVMLDSLHKFICEVNLNPVRVALNVQSFGLLKHLSGLRKALALMCEKEMKKTNDIDELMALKYHYLGWIIAQIIRCEEVTKAQRKEKSGTEAGEAGKTDFIELFIKRVLKENKLGQLEYIDFTVRECIREFPFRDCTVFKQVITHLGTKNALPSLTILRNAINGQRGFTEVNSSCSTCGNEKPDKKCSKCKAVQYCDRECQRLHWFMHKKNCARLTPNAAIAPSTVRDPVDTSELQDELAKMTAT